MSISKAMIFSAIATSMALAACGGDASPSDQPAYVAVEAPAWTKDLTLDVGKRTCTITNKTGQSFMVASTGTDIGGGLTARRDKNDCYVKDQSGVQCNWDRIERNNWCRVANPALKP